MAFAALLSALLSIICLLRLDEGISGCYCCYCGCASSISDISMRSIELSIFSTAVFFSGTGTDALGVSSLKSAIFFCGEVTLNSLISFICWCYSGTEGTFGELIWAAFKVTILVELLISLMLAEAASMAVPRFLAVYSLLCVFSVSFFLKIGTYLFFNIPI